jgi:hypothetical protein
MLEKGTYGAHAVTTVLPSSRDEVPCFIIPTTTHHIDANACCAMCVQTPSTYTQNDHTNTGIHTILHQTEDSWHIILRPPKPSSSNSYDGIC